MAKLPVLFRQTLERVGFLSPNELASPDDPNTPPDLDDVYSVDPQRLMLASGPYISLLATNPDSVLQRHGAQDLALFDKLLDDDVAFSNLQQRRLAITSRDWEVTPGDDEDPRSVAAADDFRAMLKEIGFDRVTGGLHYAIWYGYAVGEAVWTTRVFNGRRIVWLDDVVVPDRRWFGFTLDGELRYTAAFRSINGEAVPPNKFLSIRTGGTHDFAFYGLGLAHWVYWPVWFKRSALRYWALYLEKLANPTAVGPFTEADDARAKNRLIKALIAIGRDSAVVLPKDVISDVKFLEAQRSSAGSSSYSDFLREQNEAIMRIVLGQPGSSSAQPQGLGSGQAEAHSDVKAEIVKADADLICDGINNTFARWVTRWNYGEDVAPPQVFRVLDDAEDLNAVAERDVKLDSMGWRRTEESVEQVYGDGYERKPEAPPELRNAAPGSSLPVPANDDEAAELERRRAQFAAGDEVPLYVSRKLKNGTPFRAWARRQGFRNVERDLHVTVLYSRTPVDPFAIGESWMSEELRVAPGGPRKVEQLGEKGAIVLKFAADDLQWRHRSMIERGASHDFPDYQPHVTITYDGEGVDLAEVEPYQGELVFGPELFEPLKLDEEVAFGADYAFDAIEEDEIDRLAASLVDETNPVLAEFASSIGDTLRVEREARGGRLSLEGARVALLQAFERFPADRLAKMTGLSFLAERAAGEAGVSIEGGRTDPKEPKP